MNLYFPDINYSGIEIHLSFWDRLRILFGSYIRIEIDSPIESPSREINIGKIKIKIIPISVRTWRILRAWTRTTPYSVNWAMPGNKTYAVYLIKNDTNSYENKKK